MMSESDSQLLHTSRRDLFHRRREGVDLLERRIHVGRHTQPFEFLVSDRRRDDAPATAPDPCSCES
jgi:hypothetical protein